MRKIWIYSGIALVVVVVLVGGQVLMTRLAQPSSRAASAASIASTSAAQRPATPPPTFTRSASTTGIPGSPQGSRRASAPPVPLAAPGATLGSLSGPPPATVGGFNAGYLKPGSTFRLVAQPYGRGPDQAGNATIVVHIASASGLNGSTGAGKLVGINALVRVGKDGAKTYQKGGTFSAVLTLQPDPRGSVLSLGAPSYTK